MFGLSLPLVFGAGVLSFLSPCVLPLVPPYLTYMSGATFEQVRQEGGVGAAVWRRGVVTSLFFILGFSIVFIALGATATAFGQMVREYFDVLRWVAAAVIVALGLHFLGIVRIGFLYRQFRADAGNTSNVGLFGAFVIGLAFAFGWTPCIGPQLGAILSLAASEASVSRGTFLLGVYAAGLGIPFLLAAMFITRAMGVMNRLKRHMKTIERVMGGLLLGVLVFGRADYLSAYDTARGQAFLATVIAIYGVLLLILALAITDALKRDAAGGDGDHHSIRTDSPG